MGYALAVAAAVVWGLSYALGQKALAKWTVWQFTAMWSVMGLALSVPLIWRNFATVRKNFEMDDLLVVGGVVASAFVAELLILGAIKKIGASKAGVFECSYPVFIALFAALLFRERLPALFYVGTGIIVIGATVVAYAMRGSA